MPEKARPAESQEPHEDDEPAPNERAPEGLPGRQDDEVEEEAHARAKTHANTLMIAAVNGEMLTNQQLQRVREQQVEKNFGPRAPPAAKPAPPIGQSLRVPEPRMFRGHGEMVGCRSCSRARRFQSFRSAPATAAICAGTACPRALTASSCP